jgi:N-acetylmuramoyl-L-alanine amidase
MRWLLGVIVVLSASVASAATVDNVRLWQAPDHTRVVFDLSGPAEHRLFQLDNPDRLVIDLADGRWQADEASLNLAGSGVEGVRYATRPDGQLRMVLDLSGNLPAQSFVLPPNEQYGHRLVIDLRRTDRASPIERATEQVRRAVTEGRRDIIIAIDAGHGGEDPGAIGVRGTFEKHVALAIARELERLVAAEQGYTPFMVRTDDYFVSLARRRHLARQAEADFFVSVHADAFTSARPSGASVYALSNRGATSTMAEFLAESENQADRIGGVAGIDMQEMAPVVREVIVDLAMAHSMQESLMIGDQVLQRMGQVTNLHKRQVEQAGFAVLRSPDIPSILVEAGFMSNANDEANLGSRAYRQRIAQAIFAGIQDHFNSSPPPGTWVYAQQRLGAQTLEYVVQRGDTLSVIAQRHGVSLQQLRVLNQLSSDTIRIGQRLRVPYGG